MTTPSTDAAATTTTSPTSTLTSATTMRAVVQRGYGDAEVLVHEHLAVPCPGRGEVLLRVDAAALDRGTVHFMTGLPKLLRLFLGWSRPRGTFVPGRDVAGTVVAVAEGVTRFGVGDRVFGCAQGSLAEFAIAAETKLAHQPSGASSAQAAVLAISGLTAIQALDAARVRQGDRVLVIGASGGVGAYAVQLAAARGATVTGVCSAAKAEAVRAWGADRVIDYAATDPTAGDERYDVVIDIAGGAALHRLRRIITPRGALVFVGNETGGEWTGGYGRPMRWALRMLVARQRFVMLTARETAVADLERLAQFVTDRTLVPPLHAVHPFDEVPEAMRELTSGRVVGKVAISVSDAV